MKKNLIFILICSIFISFTSPIFAQSDDELFGGDIIENDDDLFFEEDGIIELEENGDSSQQSEQSGDRPQSSQSSGDRPQTSSDLSHGTLFQNGSIKIGGKFSTSMETSTKIWEPESAENTGDDPSTKTFADYLKETTLTPTVSALLSVDARPSQNLRLYTKFGLAYPFTTTETTLWGQTSIKDYLQLKELFTDFSLGDRVFFRFGLHTVTWGTGYFFSPVSDIINTSSIDPENATEQVNGALNLRTQITFPGTQNCLWLYVIPSTSTINSNTTATYARNTALAGKVDLLLGNVEIGLGGYYKYQDSPKAVFTATGGLKKINLFAEGVYQYGAQSEWTSSTDWENKSNIFQATVGFSYYWKIPEITWMGQYYYDGNDKDPLHQYMTQGNNFATAVNFARIAGNSDLTATIFVMANYGKEDLNDMYKSILSNLDISSAYFNTMTLSAMLSYSPVSTLTITAGPYLTWQNYDNGPVTAVKISATLGGGKF